MDDNARRRRQNEPSVGPTSTSRYSVPDPNAQRRSYSSTGGSDRYRPAPLTSSPTAARGIGSTAAYSGYYQEPAATYSTAIPHNTMAYQSEYGQDTRQTQNFSAYNTPMMYNVSQTGAQNSVYDASQQFSSRQPAGLQIMPTDVAAPYFPSEPTNAASASTLQAQAGASSTSAVYQQSPDQRAMLQSYPGGIASMGGMAQPGAQDQTMEDQDYAASTEMGEAYEQYQAALKEIFTNLRNGNLATASESLLGISDWLLSKVSELGDNQTLYNDRLKLWQDFNHAWLGLFQSQKDMMSSGVALQRGQSLITEDTLRNMVKELLRLCDGLDRHGLVDYEYGVWEERIVDVAEECLDLFETVGEGGAGSQAGPSHHRASR